MRASHLWLAVVATVSFVGCGIEGRIEVIDQTPWPPGVTQMDIPSRCGKTLPPSSAVGLYTQLRFDAVLNSSRIPLGKLGIRNDNSKTVYVKWPGTPRDASAEGVDERGRKVIGPGSLPALGWQPIPIPPRGWLTLDRVYAGLSACDAPVGDELKRVEPGTYRFAVPIVASTSRHVRGTEVYSVTAEADVPAGPPR